VRKSRLMVTLAMACLLVIAGVQAWALDEEERSCAAACSEVKEQCLASCRAHDNPKECDARCQEGEEDCVRQCESHSAPSSPRMQ
jgi:CDP-diacylglycerol pyrophosphatase